MGVGKSFMPLATVLLCCLISEAKVNLSTEVSAHKRLVNDLLLNYGPRSVRPNIKHNERTEVSFYFKPFILSSFDEQKQQMEVEGTIYMGWLDEFLSWDPEDYDGVEIISLSDEDIWIPDVTTYERLEIGSAEVNVFRPYIICNSSGYITFYQQSLLTAYCRLNMSKFPFDVQRCLMRFSSYSYTSDQVYLSYANTTSANENDFNLNGVWKLETFHVSQEELRYNCCLNPYIEVHYELILARIGNFYVFSIWIPCGLLSILELTVFLMHPNSGEKVSLSVTNVLAFILFQQIVVDSMPRSGDDSPIIVAYFSAMIGISCASVLASAIVLRVYHHNPSTPVPGLLRCLLCSQVSRERLAENTKRNSNTFVRSVSLASSKLPGEDGKDQTVESVSSISVKGQLKGNDNKIALPDGTHSNQLQYKPGECTEQNMADWMMLALRLDKLFLMTAVFAMLGTLLYCFIRFLM